MSQGKGSITTLFDRINFLKDIYENETFYFKINENKVTIYYNDNEVYNDKLILKDIRALDKSENTYTRYNESYNKDTLFKQNLEYEKIISDLIIQNQNLKILLSKGV